MLRRVELTSHSDSSDDSSMASRTIQELTDRWLAVFREDADRLRMTRPDVQPRATEHIDAIVTLIGTLLEGGHAYRTDDGSIFFRIASWPAYGRLARLDPDPGICRQSVVKIFSGHRDSRILRHLSVLPPMPPGQTGPRMPEPDDSPSPAFAALPRFGAPARQREVKEPMRKSVAPGRNR